MNTELAARLRAPFPSEFIGKLPKAGMWLDFVGHGAVTDRLLSVDPAWTWEPMATTTDGHPVYDTDNKGQPIGLWIRLTIAGVTRPGYGSCAPGQFDAVKVLIGDAIRNGAMRFGVALDLWIRGQAEDDEHVASATPTQELPPAATETQLNEIEALLHDLEETTREDVKAWWKERYPALGKLDAGQAAAVLAYLKAKVREAA